MFFKLFLKVLKRLSPEKKDIVRGVLDGRTETVIENNKTAKPMKAQAKKGKKEKRRTKKMADEIKKDEAAKVEEEKDVNNQQGRSAVAGEIHPDCSAVGPNLRDYSPRVR